MKIFISHASDDRELAVGLSDLLDLGLGVSQDDMFCSSSKGHIPNGQYFVEHILSRLNEANLIIALLSKAHLKSHFCGAEVGAALARQQNKQAEFYSFVVPPVAFKDLDGALYGVQSGSILDTTELGGLRDVITLASGLTSKQQTWDEKRVAFLKIAAATGFRYDAATAASLISVEDLFLEHAENATYKDKLRIVLRNNAGDGCEVSNSTWQSLTGDVKLFQPLKVLPWQVKTIKGWEPIDHGSSVIHVPAGREFRTWISPDGCTQAEILKRAAARTLGSLVLLLKFAGQDVVETRRF